MRVRDNLTKKKRTDSRERYFYTNLLPRGINNKWVTNGYANLKYKFAVQIQFAVFKRNHRLFPHFSRRIPELTLHCSEPRPLRNLLHDFTIFLFSQLRSEITTFVPSVVESPVIPLVFSRNCLSDTVPSVSFVFESVSSPMSLNWFFNFVFQLTVAGFDRTLETGGLNTASLQLVGQTFPPPHPRVFPLSVCLFEKIRKGLHCVRVAALKLLIHRMKISRLCTCHDSLYVCLFPKRRGTGGFKESGRLFTPEQNFNNVLRKFPPETLRISSKDKDTRIIYVENVFSTFSRFQVRLYVNPGEASDKSVTS